MPLLVKRRLSRLFHVCCHRISYHNIKRFKYLVTPLIQYSFTGPVKEYWIKGVTRDMDTKHIPEDIFSSSSYGVNNEVVQIKCVGEFMNESLRNSINANVFCTDNFHLPDSYNNQPTISSEGNHFDYALAGQHINHSNLASNYTTNDWNSGISTSGVACGTAKTVNEADVFSYFENAFQSKNHTKKNDGESNYSDIKREPKTLKYGSTKISHNSKGENNIANLLSSRIVSTSKNTERPSNKISDEKKVLIENISSLDPEEELAKEKNIWTRSAPSDLYYSVQSNHVVHATKHLSILCNEFKECLLDKPEQIRANLPKYGPLMRKKRVSIKKKDCHSCSNAGKCSSSSSSSGSEDSSDDDCEYKTQELEHKKNHPLRLHPELWFNDHGQMNDGPLCRCSVRAQRSGIRHNIYAGEKNTTLCEPNSNNADKLYHYRITISPPTNFLVKTPTVIEHDSHEYIFEGFSMFSHKKLGDLPLCKVIRFNIEYTIVYYEEKFPQNFTIRELDYFNKYLFQELLELVDLDLKAHGDPGGCPQYHFLPRFVRQLPENGKEILCMNEVLRYLMKSYTELISPADQASIPHMQQDQWQVFTEAIKGMIVTYPGKKPCSLRVDQLDRDHLADEGNSSEPSTTPQAHTSFSTPLDSSQEPRYPKIVHFGIRPPQLSYAGNPEYQKSWREYVKFRHLIANMPKPSHEDKRKLRVKEIKLQKMRIKNELKRNVTVTVCGKHFMKTGIMCDIVQHAMLIPVLVSHLRFHRSIDKLEEKLDYQFQNRFLIQLALTHPSYRENFGTNPDHARNSLTNCGIRQPVYGDRRIHYMNTRKRGINTLINIMSRFGKTEETESNITHNERLEFLGDAVVEFSTSVHLFHMFPELEEGGLATYRAAIVQNQHLALLAKTLGLEQYMLYAHGSDLCHDLELRHAMANCFEALMGALFLDGGIRVADKVFGEALFQDVDLLDQWVNFPPHPLQEQEPLGDRKWIEHFPMLQKLTKFEVQMGIEFTHIRLLARAFTDRSVGFINLTLGSNQRLEFLGDTVLQLIASDYLYRYFPEHHEGHLSLLRSSLVNNRTQAVVCDDLGMTEYALYSNPKGELKTKDRADLLEAFLGALYIDKGMEHCITFCDVCFFPRLQNFIMHQDWNDPKSKLQQCCLTLRTMEGGEPEIPFYKVIECMGPTNTRIYTVAVYFKGQRLAKASGHSIQQAEMNAAKKALSNSKDLFPQLDHQKRVISKSMHRQNNGNSRSYSLSNRKAEEDDNNCIVKKNNLPLAYQRRNRSKSPEQNSSIKTQSDRTDSRQTTSVITKTNSEISSSSAEKFTFASKTKQITDKAVKQMKNERDKGQGGGDEKCRDFTNNKVNTRLTSKTNPISSISKNTDLARMKTRRQTSCNALKPREMDKRVFSSTRSDCNLNSGQIMPTTKYLTRNQSKRTPEKRLSGDNIYIEDSSPSEWNVGNQPSSQTRSRSRNLTRGMLRDNERHVPFAKRTKRSRSTERIHPLDFLLSRKNHSSDHMTDTPGLLMDLMFSKNKNTPPQSTSHQSDAFNGSTYGDNHSSQPYDSYLNLISPSFSKSQSGHYENTNAVSNVLAICPVMKMFPHSGSS